VARSQSQPTAAHRMPRIIFRRSSSRQRCGAHIIVPAPAVLFLPCGLIGNPLTDMRHHGRRILAKERTAPISASYLGFKTLALNRISIDTSFI
jgi:hypothetical protein